jgi:hypothetical protein
MHGVLIGTWLLPSTMLVGPAKLVHVHCEGSRCVAIARSLAAFGRIRSEHLYSFPFSVDEEPGHPGLIPSIIANLYLSSVKEDSTNPFGYSTAGPTDDVPSSVEAILFASREVAIARLDALAATTDFTWHEVQPLSGR